jgi:hypothetical protein
VSDVSAFRSLKWMLCFAAVSMAGAVGESSTAQPGGWAALRLQQTLQEAAGIMFESMGYPIMVHRGRNGLFEQWIYDEGGWLFFQGGRLVFWRPPCRVSNGSAAPHK